MIGRALLVAAVLAVPAAAIVPRAAMPAEAVVVDPTTRTHHPETQSC
ncbi:MAG TPA: hypothetical protein VKA54_07350 [Gemmatimonadaceae bacterium]|nr:hypothetical protein [Gemmatimonadaceae bacterium]